MLPPLFPIVSLLFSCLEMTMPQGREAVVFFILCPNRAEGDEPALLMLCWWEYVGCSLLLHAWAVGEPCLIPRCLHAAGSRARLGALPGLAASLCMAVCWLSSIAPAHCGDGLALWASVCQQQLATGGLCTYLWCTLQRGCGFPCHAIQVPDSAGCEMSSVDFKGRRNSLVLWPNFPGGGWPVPAWHFWRSYHLICHGNTLCGSKLLRPASVPLQVSALQFYRWAS